MSHCEDGNVSFNIQIEKIRKEHEEEIEKDNLSSDESKSDYESPQKHQNKSSKP